MFVLGLWEIDMETRLTVKILLDNQIEDDAGSCQTGLQACPWMKGRETGGLGGKLCRSPGSQWGRGSDCQGVGAPEAHEKPVVRGGPRLPKQACFSVHAVFSSWPGTAHGKPSFGSNMAMNFRTSIWALGQLCYWYSEAVRRNLMAPTGSAHIFIEILPVLIHSADIFFLLTVKIGILFMPKS